MFGTNAVQRRSTRTAHLIPLLLLYGGAVSAQLCDNNAEIVVGDAVGLPGTEVTVELRGRSLCEVTGSGVAIGHDGARALFVDASPSDFLTSYSGDDLLFMAAEHNEQGYMSLFWAFDIGFGNGLPPRTIPAGTVLAELTYVIREDATGRIPLLNRSLTYGSPVRIKNVFGGETREIEPRLVSGSITVGSSEPVEFRRSDANGDGRQDLADAVFVLGFLFGGGSSPSCLKAADADDSGRIDLSDAVAILNFLFSGGFAPPEPFAECGFDPTSDGLSCAFFPSC